MTLSSPHAAQARTVADAILYEGYLLYPYRQSSQKNQARFQFGVLMPPAYAAVDDCEPSAAQTECLAECARRRAGRRSWSGSCTSSSGTVQAGPGAARRRAAGCRTDVGRRPALTVDGTEYTQFTEAAEREQRAELAVAELLGGEGAAVRSRSTSTRGEIGRGPGRLQRRAGRAAGPPVGRPGRGAAGAGPNGSPGPYQALRLRRAGGEPDRTSPARAGAAGRTACATRWSRRTR